MNKNQEIIKISYGKRFPFDKAYLLYVFLFVAFVIPFFVDYSMLSFSFQFISFLLALFMATSTSGIIIENRQRVKFYMSAFAVQIGKWKAFTNFSCLVLKTTMKKRENTLVNQFGDGASVIQKFNTTELYFMDSTHRKKIFCGSYDTYQEAKEKAKQLSSLFNYPIQKFSPKRIQGRKGTCF